MDLTRRTVSAAGAMLLSPRARAEPVVAAAPADADILAILKDRIAGLSPDLGFGIAVGVVGPGGRRFLSLGHLDKADPRLATPDTVFEVGSLTKAFTALLLADMAVRGEVALDDPAAKYLPARVKLPEPRGRAITLADLATHTAGLPFMPSGPQGSAPAKFTARDLDRYLADYRMTREPGAGWEYSNLGYWVLSEALAARAGQDFATLLGARVLKPLRLRSTGLALSPAMQANLAPGHDAGLRRAPTLGELAIYPLMPAAGYLFSTIGDLSRVLAVAMGYERSPLARALRLTVATRRPMSPGGPQQALGWTIFGKGADEIVLRDGGSFGQASCLAWSPARRVGVVVLSNQVASVTDIARHLLTPAFPLEHPTASNHGVIALEAAVLDSYAGRYEAQGEGVFTVTRDGQALVFDAPGDWGLPQLRIRPETPTDFYATELPLRVTFELDGGGVATGILIYPPRGQKAVPAHRLP